MSAGPPEGVESGSCRESAAAVALAARTCGPWHLLSHALEEAGTALGITAGEQPVPEELGAVLQPGVVGEGELDEIERMLGSLAESGTSLLTVLDDRYPVNLRRVYDRTPLLFVRGELRDDDERAPAVVGTRKATADGLCEAKSVARGLVDMSVTVVSGLALGVDGAAHKATLEAGGRTIAVLGHGIRHPTYPRAHAELAERIIDGGGAVVSQFLSDAPPLAAVVEFMSSRSRRRHGNAVSLLAFPIRRAAAGLARARASGGLWLYEHIAAGDDPATAVSAPPLPFSFRCCRHRKLKGLWAGARRSRSRGCGTLALLPAGRRDFCLPAYSCVCRTCSATSSSCRLRPSFPHKAIRPAQTNVRPADRARRARRPRGS